MYVYVSVRMYAFMHSKPSNRKLWPKLVLVHLKSLTLGFPNHGADIQLRKTLGEFKQELKKKKKNLKVRNIQKTRWNL